MDDLGQVPVNHGQWPKSGPLFLFFFFTACKLKVFVYVFSHKWTFATNLMTENANFEPPNEGNAIPLCPNSILLVDMYC